jgi:hypothetical protein
MPAVSADRRKLQREIAASLREKDREALAALRVKIDAAKTERRQMVRAAREACRTALLSVRERQAVERRRLTLEHQAERAGGRAACAAGKAEAKERGHGLEDAAKGELRDERVFQRQIRHAGKRPPERSTARERAQEDDDAVRNNLPPELVPVFDKHRRSFKGSPRRSRTEQFLEWAEENPDEVLAVQQAEADVALKELLRQEREVVRAQARSRPRLSRKARARQLSDVPF